MRFLSFCLCSFSLYRITRGRILTVCPDPPLSVFFMRSSPSTLKSTMQVRLILVASRSLAHVDHMGVFSNAMEKKAWYYLSRTKCTLMHVGATLKHPSCKSDMARRQECNGILLWRLVSNLECLAKSWTYYMISFCIGSDVSTSIFSWMAVMLRVSSTWNVATQIMCSCS